MKHKAELYELVQGIGKITIAFDNKQPLPYYSITIHNADAKIEYFGTKALEFGKSFFEDEVKNVYVTEPIENVIKAAETATNGSIQNGTRKKENKLARYLLAWYLVRFVKVSTSKAGEIINRDHATVLHGMKLIDKHEKYRNDYENDSIRKFKELLKINV